MFNWLGNLFPYSDLHSLNLDWILNKMKETAAQAAKAIADSANALAQVIEAKTAAQDAQTAAQNAQTAANNAQTAADNAATSAENAVTVAQAAKSAAQTAQSAAENALSKFPVKRADIADLAIGNKQLGADAVSGDKIVDKAITTPKIKNGAVTNEKMSSADFYVGIGSYSLSETTTSTAIAAGQASFSFSRSATNAVIFVAYAGSNYNDGNTSHHLFMYSDPFILNTMVTKRVVDITLEDFNNQTGENTEYKGTLTISVSASRVVNGVIAFAETLPFSDDIAIPYGISGLSARPKL